MKKTFITLFALFFNYLFSQNIVPNGNFEDFNNCPSALGQINKVNFWLSPTAGTPDYFNRCAPIYSSVCVPQNIAGFQEPKTGNGYTLILVYSGGYPVSGREYIQVELKEPLTQGVNYCVKFYISLCDSSQYAIREIGAYFSDTAIYRNDILNFPYNPQIYYNSINFIDDKVNWTEITGSFVALDSFKYITIGNYKDDANTDSLYVGGGGDGWKDAGFYIDDVSVYACNAPVYVADAGNNTIICKGKNDSVQLGTTPRDEYLYWWLPASGLNNDSIANPKAGPQTTTTYYLHQKDFKFDETIDSVTVYVEECGYSINAPNAFTPNSDGVNDIFKAHGKNIKEIHGKIFNRWGEELFEWSGVNEGWNGKYNGQDVSAGAYFYVIRVVYMNGKMEIKKGSIEVIR